jgi:ABC-2 type transport system ATP-binding protein
MQTEVRVRNLVKRYKDLVAVDHLDLEIQKGEIYGLLGPNGSGKTTLINCILSLLRYEKGEVEIFGEPMKPNAYHLKQNIGVVSQEPAVYGELSVYENIDYFCGLYVPDKAVRRKLVE